MTALLERSAPSVRPAAGYRAGRLALTALPWIVVGTVVVVALRLTGTPAGDIVTYAAYWAFTLVLPGTLVHRAVRGSRGNLGEDLAYGAAVGLLLELLVWASAAAVGAQALLRWWAVPVVLAFLVVPGLRQHWRIASPQPLPVLWSWASAGGVLLVAGWAVAAFASSPLPPADAFHYQDLMYHLALVQELTRDMPFQVPQLAGDELRYHYLSDAHMATASMITGTPPATVLLRLWIIPVAATAVLVTAALAREISGRWWAGPLAGTIAFAGMSISFGAPASANDTPLSFNSPSQTYSLPLMMLLAACVVDVLRGRRMGAAWVLVPPLALACAGAKSSALPPLAAGLVVASAVIWWRDRRVPRAALAFLATVVAAMVLGLRMFAGGGAGTLQVQFLSMLSWYSPYKSTLGHADSIVRDGLVPRGVATASAAGLAFCAALLAWWLVIQAPRLIGLAALVSRRTRSDPVVWMLGAAICAGVGAAWCFYHPSASQFYFIASAQPFGALLSVYFLAERVRRWWVPLAAMIAGGVWAVLVPEAPLPARPSFVSWLWALSQPLLWTLLSGVVTVVLVAAVLRRRPRTLGPGLVVGVAAAVLGGSIGAAMERTTERLLALPAPPPSRYSAVTADEMRAALWLDANAADEDVVVTNVHCRPVQRIKPCDARAFWVAGLGGHRTLVESWGYSDETVAAHGRDGLRYQFQPAPDPALFARNERVFTAPTAAELADLRRSHGVRWIFADARAGAVSPLLAGLATPRFTAGPVTIYELA